MPVLSDTRFRRWQGLGRSAFLPGFVVAGRASESGTGTACREGRACGRCASGRLGARSLPCYLPPSGGDSLRPVRQVALLSSAPQLVTPCTLARPRFLLPVMSPSRGACSCTAFLSSCHPHTLQTQGGPRRVLGYVGREAQRFPRREVGTGRAEAEQVAQVSCPLEGSAAGSGDRLGLGDGGVVLS